MKLSRYNVYSEVDGDRYVYNGVSGGLARVSQELRAGSLDRLSAATLGQLVGARIILPDATDEVSGLERRYEDAKRSKDSFHLTIVPSMGCNFDCPYCFEIKQPSIMSAITMDAIVTLVDQRLVEYERLDVTWYGGEPLVGRKVIEALAPRIMERCAARGAAFDSGIVTNGWLLNRSTAEALVSCGVSEAQVTLDGPPDVHNVMRPLAGGAPTFARIVRNLIDVAGLMHVSIRVNIDSRNASKYPALLQELYDRGLAGKIGVYPAQIVASNYGVGEPSASYGTRCLFSREFAELAVEFNRMAGELGLGASSLPTPVGVPCTAVAPGDLIIGSHGELYRCWESVGRAEEIVGSLHGEHRSGSRSDRWLLYKPFSDEECRACIALPACMGGCATHAMSSGQYENRCGTFRHTYQRQVDDFVRQRTSSPSPGGRKLLPVSPLE